jgi:hypothetical protein
MQCFQHPLHHYFVGYHVCLLAQALKITCPTARSPVDKVPLNYYDRHVNVWKELVLMSGSRSSQHGRPVSAQVVLASGTWIHVQALIALLFLLLLLLLL